VNATALPEVVGDAGVLVDPDDIDGWVAAIDAIIGDRERRARSSRPDLRAAHFSGERPRGAAQRTVAP
jgi:glycosyltransferase involved in cell wall biosynthesis